MSLPNFLKYVIPVLQIAPVLLQDVNLKPPMRCFDCNSGGSGFGSAICPPNGNLKQEVLTTVRCTERCFSRTSPANPGVVQRGCSTGIGFFLSRPLPKDGCVKVADDNWWCFCAESLCNVDDMTQYGAGKEPPPIEQPDEKSEDESLGLWSREEVLQTKKPEAVTTRTRIPEVVTDWTRKPTIPQQTTTPKEYKPTSKKAVAPARDYDESIEAPPMTEEEAIAMSYEDPLQDWEQRQSVESFEQKEEDFYREIPFDQHYTQHTHNA